MPLAPSFCPICREPIIITRLHCPSCKSTIEGEFDHGPFAHLSPDEKNFIQVFVACRGNIKEVEKRLGVSYPTVRGRLDSIAAKLDQNAAVLDPETRSLQRMEILNSIKRGDMTVNEAAEILKEL